MPVALLPSPHEATASVFASAENARSLPKKPLVRALDALIYASCEQDPEIRVKT